MSVTADSRRGSCQLLLIQGEEVVSYCCFKERNLSVTAVSRRGSCQLLANECQGFHVLGGGGGGVRNGGSYIHALV